MEFEDKLIIILDKMMIIVGVIFFIVKIMQAVMM